MASDKVLTFTANNWNNEVLKSATPVLVDVWAPWCGPCLRIAPFIDQFATEYEGKMLVGKLNADENASVLSQYGIMGLPTLMVFKNGQPVGRITGALDKNELKKRIDAALQA